MRIEQVKGSKFHMKDRPETLTATEEICSAICNWSQIKVNSAGCGGHASLIPALGSQEQVVTESELWSNALSSSPARATQ